MELTGASDDALECCADEGTPSAMVVSCLRALRASRRTERDARRALDQLIRRATSR